MKDRIKNGANLLESHVFQFDFLNDEFTKLPAPLQDIINDKEKRKKLVIYINPPYAEAGNARMRSGQQNKQKVSNSSHIWEKYKTQLGLGIRELFTQFVIRIYTELSPCKLAIFSTPKYIVGSAFKRFRVLFPMTFLSGFLIPAATFDNVRGEFAICYIIWDLAATPITKPIQLAIYNATGRRALTDKTLIPLDNTKRISTWMSSKTYGKYILGFTGNFGPDFQHNQDLCILNLPKLNRNKTASNATKYTITEYSLIQSVIYLVVRFAIPHTWLNNRDQFLHPSNAWQFDIEFHNNCLTFILFHNKNYITVENGTNHWIPFSEAEVNAKEEFESHFMNDFISGRLHSQDTQNSNNLLNEQLFIPSEPLVFSPEATAVFDAGRELWRYYHAQPNANPNASYYDIRAHFQGRNDKGKMNPKSDDKEYMRLLGNLKEAMEVLRLQIVPKVYEYGFLIE